MIKLIVTGGRAYKDREKVFATLDKILAKHESVFIIHGGARTKDRDTVDGMWGADYFAGEWAKSRGQPCAQVDAAWDYFGKGAGPIRNGWMLVLGATGVVAFPGGEGTADMVEKAKICGVPVMEVA